MIIQFIRGQVEGVVSTASQQAGQAQNILGQIQGYVPKVQSAWRGGDEKEFEADVQRKLVPAMMQLIAAISGFGGNLTKATGVMDQADKKIQGLANGLGDVFGKIF
jgi:WXG100 family type VII secretion target